MSLKCAFDHLPSLSFLSKSYQLFISVWNKLTKEKALILNTMREFCETKNLPFEPQKRPATSPKPPRPDTSPKPPRPDTSPKPGPQDDADDDDSNNTAAIVGGVVGCLVVVAFLVAVFVFLRKRKGRQEGQAQAPR